MIRGMGEGHGADSKPHISAALSSRPFPTSLRDFPIPPPRKSIDIYYLPQSPGRILLAYNSDGMVMDIMLCQCVDDFSKVEK